MALSNVPKCHIYPWHETNNRPDVVFCSITKERTEVILQGTSSPDPNDPAAVWQEFNFKCKPGDLWRRPCFISPYHYRLDWLMWFAAFQVRTSLDQGKQSM